MARSDKAAAPATLDPTKNPAKPAGKAEKTSARAAKASKAPRPPAASKKPRHPYMLNDQSWDRQVVMDIVCNAIASSSKSIASILASGHDGHALPEYATVARWLGEEDAEGRNPLRDQYARAKVELSESLKGCAAGTRACPEAEFRESLKGRCAASENFSSSDGGVRGKSPSIVP